MTLNNNWEENITTDFTRISIYCVRCLICEESVELSEIEEMALENGKPVLKVCDKCRKAVMKMREVMEEE